MLNAGNSVIGSTVALLLKRVSSTGINNEILSTLNNTPNITRMKYRSAIGTNGGAKDNKRDNVFIGIYIFFV